MHTEPDGVGYGNRETLYRDKRKSGNETLGFFAHAGYNGQNGVGLFLPFSQTTGQKEGGEEEQLGAFD